MAEVAIRSLHAVGSVPAVMLPTAFPPTPIGEVELLTIWNEWVPEAGIYLPFQLEIDDWLIAVVTPTLDQGDRLEFANVDLESVGGWRIDNLWAGVNFCKVAGLWGGLPPMVHARNGTPIKATFFVYRGVQEIGILQTEFAWNARYDTLIARHGAIPYSAPAAEIVRLTYARMYPELSAFSYDPDYGYWGDTIPVEEYHVNPNWQVTLQLNSRKDLSPTDETSVYAGGPWDPKYENYAWGQADYYTIILSTQAVDLLPEDAGNPAPVGSAHLPIFGPSSEVEGPSAIVDEAGNVLVDEDGNVLIFG